MPCCGAALALASLLLHGSTAAAPHGAPGYVHQHWSVAEGLPVDSVNGILQSRDGYLWLATFDGLVRFDGVRFTILRSADEAGLPSDRLTSVREDAGGSLWVTTEQNDLVRFQGGRFEAIRPASSQPQPPHVLFLQQDRDGTIWVGTDRGAYLVRGDELEEFRPEPRPAVLWMPPLQSGPDGSRWFVTGRRLYREDELVFESGEVIRALAFDREGSVWVAPAGDGLYRLRRSPFRVHGKREGLPGENVYPILEAPDGTIWLGTMDAGLVRLAGGSVRAYSVESGLPANFVWSLAHDRDGTLWVGGSGLCRFDGERCSTDGLDPRLHAEVHVRAIHRDRSGRLWVGTEWGLYRLETDGRWRHFGTADGLPHRWVRVFHEDEAGRLWIGTNGGGLAVHDGSGFRVLGTEQGLSSSLVRAVFQDRGGVLWIGTENAGLCRIELRDGSLERPSIRAIRQRDGLFDDGIHQILEDDQGRFWMNTNRGLFWVRRSELDDLAHGRRRRVESIAYTERDGLRDREGNGGMQPAGIRASDGRPWFPTQGGAVVVDPAAAGTNRVPPPVVLESVSASGEERSVQPGTPVQLAPGQRSFEIDYTALSFADPAKVLFRYRLWGHDQDWIEAGTRRTAYYTNVPPGSYRFHVLACNNDGVWNEQGAALQLEVPPYLHETRTFQALAALLLVLLGTGGVRLRFRQIEAHRSELERLVAERTKALAQQKSRAEKALEEVAVQASALALEKLRTEEALAKVEEQAAALARLGEARSRFFSDVSHELRTPLTLILGPLREALRGAYGAAGGTLHEQLAVMERNGRRLQRLINQILDLQTLEAGALRLDVRVQDLAALLRQVVRGFEPLAASRQVRLELDAGARSCLMAFDADQFEKVLVNLLSNALKFTAPGGAVSVRLQERTDAAEIAVSDTGAGIPPEDLPRIFDRFYRSAAPEARSVEGTGLGLALAQELTELHGGTIEVRSAPGQGSTFTVRLPLDAPAPALDEPFLPGGVAGLPLATEALETAATQPIPERPGPGALATETAQFVPGPPDPIESPGGADLGRTTVLVVDDNPDMRRHVRRILEPNYRVLEAGDGRRGLELALEALPDLVVAATS